MERAVRARRNARRRSSRKLNAGLNAVLRQPDIAERLKQLNVEFRENTPEEFRAFVAAEMEKWGTRGARGQYQAGIAHYVRLLRTFMAQRMLGGQGSYARRGFDAAGP